jgi:hypothetical protein
MNCTVISIDKVKMIASLVGFMTIATGTIISENKRDGTPYPGIWTKNTRWINNTGWILHVIGWFIVAYAVLYDPQRSIGQTKEKRVRAKTLKKGFSIALTCILTLVILILPAPTTISMGVAYGLYIAGWMYFLYTNTEKSEAEQKWKFTNKSSFMVSGVSLIVAGIIVLHLNRIFSPSDGSHGVHNALGRVYNHGFILYTLGFVMVACGISSCDK